MWIKEYHQRPPVEFEKLLELPNLSSELLKVINELLIRKRLGDELAIEMAIPLLNAFLDQQLQFFTEYVNLLDKSPKIPSTDLNSFFLRWIK
jgi:predicted nucleotidyltransferase